MKLFRLFQKKQKKTVEEVLPQNDYYESISEKLGIAQVVLYLSLLAFVVLSFLRNTDLITYHNFYYFIKDLNASAETVDVWNTDSVSYPTDDVQSFTLYRDGLAVAGDSAVTVFTATGRQTISQTITYHNPVAVGSGKYLLVYDLGGTKYSLYNSYTQIFSGECDYPISDGTVSKSGTYALTSASSDYNSVVYLYNSNFSLINAYKKNGYVMDVAINPKGNSIALVTSTAKDGLFHTELLISKIGETKATATLNIAESLALSCVFTGNDTVSILCSGGLYAYEANGNLINSYEFSGDTVASFAVNASGHAVCLKSLGTSERRSVIVFDKRGSTVYKGSADRQIDSMARYDDIIYLQTAYGVMRLDAKRGSYREELCNTEQTYLLAVGNKEFLLCSSKKATYMSFD